jgi:hypothetical protein
MNRSTCLVLAASLAALLAAAPASGGSAASIYDSGAGVLAAIPADLMPPGPMTEDQAKAFRQWADETLGGAAATITFALESVRAGTDGTVVTGHLDAPVQVHGRTARCRVRAVLEKGEPPPDPGKVDRGALFTVTGRLADQGPLVPIKDQVPAEGIRVNINGWSPKFAFFLLSLEEGRAPGTPAPPERPPLAPKGGADAPPPSPSPPAVPPAEPAKPDVKAPVYFGLEAKGARKVVYIVDKSGSMTDSIVYVNRELKRSLRALGVDAAFHVLFFSSGPPAELPFRKLVHATEENKRAADKFIDGIVPQGQTDPSDALSRAFALKPDAIFLLTDGEFDKAIVRSVRELNKEGKVRVYTIGFLYKQGEKTLQAIAADNGGAYRFVAESDLEGLLKEPAPPAPAKPKDTPATPPAAKGP